MKKIGTLIVCVIHLTCLFSMEKPSKKKSNLNELYNKVFSFATLYENKASLNPPIFISDKLTSLLTIMKNAQKKNVDEDQLGKFGYKKCELTVNNNRTLIILNFLKKYRLETAKTNESLPPYTYNKPIAQPILQDHAVYNALTWDQIAAHDNTQSTGHISLEKYPAYCTLIWDIEKLFNENNEKIKALVYCLYINEKQLCKMGSQGLYTNLVVDFSLKTTHLFQYKEHQIETHLNELYDLLQVVKKAKKLQHIKEVEDLEVPQLCHWDGTCFQTYSTPSTYVLCPLIKKYNTTKKEKITPVAYHYLGYTLHEKWNLPLPDASDNSLFNTNKYALKEFGQLVNDIKASLISPQKKEKVIELYGKEEL